MLDDMRDGCNYRQMNTGAQNRENWRAPSFTKEGKVDLTSLLYAKN